MTELCMHCNKPIEPPEYEEMDYHKHGRTWKCSECGKKILFQKPATNYIQDKNGTLTRKYKPKKR